MAEEAIKLPTKEEIEAQLASGDEEIKDTDDAVEESIELSDVEKAAYEKGWRPQEEYEGDDGKWIPAKEFLDRAPLFEGLSKANKKIKKQEKMLKELMEMNRQTRKNALEQAKKELRQQRVDALQDGDYDKAVDLEDKTRKIDEELKGEDENNDVAPELDETFVEWTESNEWYGKKPRMRMYADSYGAYLRGQNPDMEMEEFLEAVTEEVKEAFPSEFSKPLPNRGNAPGNQAGRKSEGAVMSKKISRLTPEQRKLGNEFVRDGVMESMEDYIESLEAAGMLEKE